MSEFYNVLRKLREEKGLTQKEVATALNISPAAYSLYEKGLREPKYDMLEKIAEYFGVSVGYLMTGDKDYIYLLSKNEGLYNNYHSLYATLAAHFDGDEYTEEELHKIKEFAEFVKSQRKNTPPAE